MDFPRSLACCFVPFVCLLSLTAASTNEFAEIILGGSIVIPAAFILMGPQVLEKIASGGPFDLPFVTMSALFVTLYWGGPAVPGLGRLGLPAFWASLRSRVTRSNHCCMPFLSCSSRCGCFFRLPGSSTAAC